MTGDPSGAASVSRRAYGVGHAQVSQRAFPFGRLRIARRSRRPNMCQLSSFSTRPADQRNPASSAGDRRRRLVGWLPARKQLLALRTEPPLSAPRDLAHRVRCGGPALPERSAEERPVAIGPRCFREDAADVAVAGARDRALSALVPAGVLGWHETEVAHELRGARKASEIAPSAPRPASLRVCVRAS